MDFQNLKFYWKLVLRAITCDWLSFVLKVLNKIAHWTDKVSTDPLGEILLIIFN